MDHDVRLGVKREYTGGGRVGWSRAVSVDGVAFIVGVERGRRRRIAFKPRGQNYGFWWYGFVRRPDGEECWTERVPKSLGARGLLIDAGLLPNHRCKPGRSECRRCGDDRRAVAR